MKRLLILIATLALVAAACGGSDDGGVATLEDTEALQNSVSDATQDVDDEQALLAFAACMRDNGIDGFPDPSLNADGSVDFFTGGGDPVAEVDNDTAEAAVNACLPELEGVSFAPGGADFDITEIQDQLVAFAQCMRDNGIDFDDPDLSGFASGELSNPFAELDITDPDVAAAIEDCQTIFADLGIPGFGS